MPDIDLTKIKYYPDRFYICLDGFDIDNLITFITDTEIGQQQAIFIHEYYHYLTNIATFPGIRQFTLNFCDRYRILINLGVAAGIDAFPINSNNLANCQPLIEYWKKVTQTINEDDIDYNLVTETANSATGKFEIVSIQEVLKPMDFPLGDERINGGRKLIQINITGILGRDSFILTYGAMDEFLSSAIDEYLYENDLYDIDASFLSQRPFYPYGFFDALLSFYEIRLPSAFEKILIAYFALNTKNPPVKLIGILEKLKAGGYDDFQSDPEAYLLQNFIETPEYETVLNEVKKFATECEGHGRVHISQALKYYYDKFYTAQKLKEQDFFYFIRPFFITEVNTPQDKQKFLLALSRIINQFTPPVILKDHVFWYVDKLTTFGESTMLILATYEIFESIKKEMFAKRPAYLKGKYIFPDRETECDNPDNFLPPPIRLVFHLALNEVGLYKLYLEELEKRKGEQS